MIFVKKMKFFLHFFKHQIGRTLALNSNKNSHFGKKNAIEHNPFFG